jgi:hypothetical protein
MDTEKRRAGRHLVCVLAQLELETQAKKRSALIDDLSVEGAHLLTCEPLRSGERLELALHVGAHTVLETGARVVRATVRSPERAALWTHDVAVEFDAPIAALAEIAEQLAKER